jgi:hypothetical protein
LNIMRYVDTVEEKEEIGISANIERVEKVRD